MYLQSLCNKQLETMTPIVAYLRTAIDPIRALELDLIGKRAALDKYCRQHGCKVLAEFTEVESRIKSRPRPRLKLALDLARNHPALLVMPSIKGLGYCVPFLTALSESGVEFLVLDLPVMNREALPVLLSIADHSREQARLCQREALQAAKARGVKLGSARPGHWDGREDRRLAGILAGGRVHAELMREAAREAYRDLTPTIQALRSQGRSFQSIADYLNQHGHKTRTGARWHPNTVRTVLLRIIPQT